MRTVVGIAVGVAALLLASALVRYNVVRHIYVAPLGLAGLTLVVSGLLLRQEMVE